ncbi:MAG TPA: sigma-70 family RNA polymerase sigma factor [Gemmataceae bacterium]|nr:sigma-70 family RNA polymerase sigma factor [Gemmataceae bacterium]
MTAAPLPRLVRSLRRTLDATNVAALSDDDLLARFRESGDPAAFEAIVRRHGSRVFAACRRVLTDPADAEDAFQATFVVFMRRPGAVRGGQALGSWLFAVAHRVALQARATRKRRERLEAKSLARRETVSESSWREACAVLHEELDRLPNASRRPLILCYLEGASRDEAAQQLGRTLNSVKKSLEKGREALRKRLARRGVTLSAGLLSAVAEEDASAVPTGQCVRSAVSMVAGSSVRPAVATLARSLQPHSFRMMLGSCLAASVMVACAVFGGSARPADPPAKDAPPAPVVRTTAAKHPTDPDTDRDGLSDFQETHKYKTDPNKKDTAGEGTPDGDLKQRREFTYSVRAIVRVMPPYNLAAMSDDYQDVRVLKETKEYAELEITVYPFNTNADAIRGNPNWKKDYAGMKEYLAPGVTTNWDDAMRQDLLRELAADGIDPDKLTDKEVVEQVSRWLFKRSKHKNMFCTFYVGFRDGKPVVLPGTEAAFQRDKGESSWTVEEQYQNELFGKEMFARKTYGTCTSTAVYETTVLRALGIPTRMILCIPLADGSDPAQVEMVEKGLTNHQVRAIAAMGVIAGGTAFASHTFCEVFVGGRWRRLNSAKLGQNVLEPGYLGLMLKVHTFNDLSEAKLAETWGTRYAKGQRDDVFRHSNPYRLMEVSDHFGKDAKLPNPPADDKEHRRVTISKAYQQDSKDAPAEIRALRWSVEQGAGRFFVHCDEWLENAGDYLQYKLFMRRADRNFALKAKGQRDVACQISMNFYSYRGQKLCELEVIIPPAEYARMAKDVEYTLHPVNGIKGYEWKVRDGVTVTRP